MPHDVRAISDMLDLFVPTFARDLPQCELLLRSLDRFVAPDVISSLTIANIDRAETFEQVTRLDAGKFRPSTRYLQPRELGLADDLPGNGWLRQQVAKLLFARQVRTEFYMALDSKNMALGPVRATDVMDRGKAAWTLEPMSPRKMKWWRGSAWALGHSGFVRSPQRLAVSSATPFIFHTASVIAMIDWLEQRHGEPLQRFFEKRRPVRGCFMTPTEFTLYYVYLDREALSDRWHFASDTLHDMASALWTTTPREIRAAKLRRILDGSATGLFTAIQYSVWQELTNTERAALGGQIARPGPSHSV